VTTNATTPVESEDTLDRSDDAEPTGAPDRAASDADELPAADRRALARAWAAGTVPVMVAFTWLLMAGRWAPFQRQYFDDFFDLQARAFLDGRWDVPSGSTGFEGFLIDGRTYIYFGPFPALLRIPVLLVTDRFDGRLTTVSMLLAMVVLAVAAHRLNLAVRAVVRGAAPVSRVERLATAGLAVAVVGGIPLWLASVAVVYHEAILWGLALTLAAFAATLGWLRRPTVRSLVWATALTAAATASRPTLGLGVLCGLALVAVLVAASRLAARRSGRPPTVLPGVRLGGLVLVGVVGFLACGVPNIVKFGNPVGPPIDRQIASFILVDRQEYLEANDGSYFGTGFVPTTLLQYSRPDALAFRGDFPWVDFPPGGPHVVGDAVFDGVEWTSSVPLTFPALVVLALPGVVWLARAVRRRDGSLGLLALWLGTGFGAAGALTIGFIAHRYIGDMAPIVILPALCGAHVLLGRAPARRAVRRTVGGALAVLVVFGAWVNLGLGVQHQRERGANIPEEWRTDLVRWRADLPGVRRSVVEVSPDRLRLPAAADGTLAVVGDCLGLYQRVGDIWYGAGRGPGVGVHHIRVDLDALDQLDPGQRAPLVTFGDGPDAAVVGLARLRDGTVRADLGTPGSDDWAEGWAHDLDGEVTVRVVADPRTADRYLWVGRAHLNVSPVRDPEAVATVGRLPAGLTVPGAVDRYPGDIAEVPFDPSLCRDATGVG